MPETRTLVEHASRGDAGAVDELLAAHLDALLAYVRRRATDLPHAKESASDLVQSACREVLGQLADGRFEWRGEAEFRAWLFEAALFKIRNRRRYWRAGPRDLARERRIDGACEPRADGPANDLQADHATPSQHAIRKEEDRIARELLERLPARYRQVIELARIEGLDHAEVAQRMAITPAASRMLLSRALARLATLAGDG